MKPRSGDINVNTSYYMDYKTYFNFNRTPMIHKLNQILLLFQGAQ